MNNGQKHENDPVEDWLQGTLGERYNPEAPLDAWQRLESKLPPEKRRRRALIVWWTAGAALIMLFFSLLKNTGRPAPQPLQSAPVVDNKAITPSATTFAATEDHVFTPKSPLQHRAAAVSQNAILETQGSSVFADQAGHFTAPESENNGIVAQNSSPDSSLQPEHFSTEIREKQILDLQILPLCEKTWPEYALVQTTALNPEPLPSLIPVPLQATQLFVHEIARPLRFRFGVNASPTLFYQKKTAPLLPGLAFSENPKRPANGWQSNIYVAFEPLRNWSIALGLGYSHQRQEARHNATLRLMDGVCLNVYDPGLKEYEFSYAVFSGGGTESQLTLRLQQQAAGSAMPADEPFTLDMKTVRRSTEWSVPLSVERRFGAGRWKPFIRGGTRFEFSEKSKTEVTHFNEVCQDLCFQSGRVPAIQSVTTSQASLGWLAGAGAEQWFSPRTALRLELFFMGNKQGLLGGFSAGLLFSNHSK